MTTLIDKAVLKEALIEFTAQDPDFVNELMLEINEELRKARRKKIETIINEDFEEYDEVFKALA